MCHPHCWSTENWPTLGRSRLEPSVMVLGLLVREARPVQSYSVYVHPCTAPVTPGARLTALSDDLDDRVVLKLTRLIEVNLQLVGQHEAADGVGGGEGIRPLGN